MKLYYLHVAFQIWMIVDAVRRRAEYYWYLIILFVPFGSLVYFFMVKVHDFRSGRAPLRPVARGASLDDLRRGALETPSASNQLALADALGEKGRYDEAISLYDRVLEKDPEERRALHGLGRCQLGAGRASEAVEALWKLAEVDNAYRDHAAILDLAEALWQDGRREETVELLAELVRSSPRVNHRVALAHYQKEAGRDEEARRVLEEALADYEGAPRFVRRRDRRWAKRAESMLRSLPAAR